MRRGSAQRLLTGGRGSVAASQNPKTVLQVGRDLVGSEHANAGGGKLQGQRQAAESGANLADGTGIPGLHGEVRLGRACPLGEQLDGGETTHFDRVSQPRVEIRRGQAVHAPDDFAGGAQRLAAGGQDPQAGAIGQEVVDQPGAGIDQVLAVVQ